MTSPEQLQDKQENRVETQESASNQLEKLNNKPESSIELSPRDIETQAERARLEALETAISVEAGGKEKNKPKDHTDPVKRGQINKKQRDESYSRTMKRVQSELPINSRLFSKVIHNKAIEKTSDILGNTIARPNAILSGAVFALISTLVTYAIAKKIGYLLSGSESIFAFTIGWIIGLVYDYFRVLITGNKS